MRHKWLRSHLSWTRLCRQAAHVPCPHKNCSHCAPSDTLSKQTGQSHGCQAALSAALGDVASRRSAMRVLSAGVKDKKARQLWNVTSFCMCRC